MDGWIHGWMDYFSSCCCTGDQNFTGDFISDMFSTAVKCRSDQYRPNIESLRFLKVFLSDHSCTNPVFLMNIFCKCLEGKYGLNTRSRLPLRLWLLSVVEKSRTSSFSLHDEETINMDPRDPELRIKRVK